MPALVNVNVMGEITVIMSNVGHAKSWTKKKKDSQHEGKDHVVVVSASE